MQTPTLQNGKKRFFFALNHVQNFCLINQFEEEEKKQQISILTIEYQQNHLR